MNQTPIPRPMPGRLTVGRLGGILAGPVRQFTNGTAQSQFACLTGSCMDPGGLTEEQAAELDGVTLEASARRLVACWNACVRMETDVLEVAAGPDGAPDVREWFDTWGEVHQFAPLGEVKALAQERDRLLVTVGRMRAALLAIVQHHVKQNGIKGRDESRSKTLSLARSGLEEVNGDGGMLVAMVKLAKALGSPKVVDAFDDQCIEAAIIELAAERLAGVKS